LGINSSLPIRALERKIESAKHHEEFMPKEEDYAKAKAYLKSRSLPLSLINMYDYLDE
jgi:hypothetical protein